MVLDVVVGQPLQIVDTLKYKTDGNVPAKAILTGDEQSPGILLKLILFEDQFTIVEVQHPVLLKYNKNSFGEGVFITVFNTGVLQDFVDVGVGVGVTKQGFIVGVGVGVGVGFTTLHGFIPVQVLQSL